MSLERDIFRRASTTYYWSSVFFPKAVREDVFRLYSFVRLADDYVDSDPAQKAKFKALRRAWAVARTDLHFDSTPHTIDTADERAVKNMVAVVRQYGFDEAWVEAFLDSMQADLDGRVYQTLEDTLWYVHGSAEVIGLMMAKILNLSPEAYEAAKLQGRAMQMINCIRDIAEDARRGRCYFPQDDLTRFALPGLTPDAIAAHPGAFKRFLQFELQRYHQWQAAAREGFRHIPRRQRIAIRAAVDMYDWTAKQIAEAPQVVLERSVRPTKRRVVMAGLRRMLNA